MDAGQISGIVVLVLLPTIIVRTLRYVPGRVRAVLPPTTILLGAEGHS
jgi:hypothetical protein